MKKFDQKIVVVHGSFNSGKTILYNLFSKEKNYKYIDIDLDHKVSKHIERQTDLESWIKLKPILKTIKDKNYETFEDMVLFLTKRFSTFNFIIKSGHNKWVHNKLNKNFIHLYVIRNPKISWLTQSQRIYISLTKFIFLYKIFFKDMILNKIPIIKIEDVSNNNLINSLIQNKLNLKNTKSITSHDIELLKKINITTIYDDLERIDIELKTLIKKLNYDNEKDNKLIDLIIEGKINKLI